MDGEDDKEKEMDGKDKEKEMDDDEWKKQNGKSKDKDETKDMDQAKEENKKLGDGLGEYKKNWAKNIAELKLVMESLKEKFPFPEDLLPMPASKRQAAMKEKKKDKQQLVKRQASMRNKGGNKDRYVTMMWHMWPDFDINALLSSSSIPAPPNAVVAAVGASTLAIPVATASATTDPLALASISASLNEDSAIPAATNNDTQPLSTQSLDLLAPSPSLSIAASSGHDKPTPTSMLVKPTTKSITPSQESLVIGGGTSAIAALPAEAQNTEAM